MAVRFRMAVPLQQTARLSAPPSPRAADVLTPEVLGLLGDLHALFEPQRRERLAARGKAQEGFDRGDVPDFLPQTRAMREMTWTVRPAPADLQQRWVEITGPVERKMMVNAFNSGADCFMADFEDANSPTWANCVEGQVNLLDFVRGRLELTTPEGKHYTVAANPATLIVRPRGWHLEERHVTIAGAPISASLFDAAVFIATNGKALLAQGSGPYLYLPKMEHHLEARLWNDALLYLEGRLGLPFNTVRVTVLIETLPAAFQMEEILYELRDRIVGLNAGRWDYLFSSIKTLRNHPDKVLPDRAAVTMAVPFMRAYAKLLVATCHKRGAHAMGGMAAFIPNRKDAAVTERALRKVREDKERESGDGFDGTWVAHPDLVPVARTIFERNLKGEANQLGRKTTLVRDPAALLDFKVPGAAVTEDGVRHNIRAALLYIEAWLRGVGAVAIDNLMEDAATAEISRAQLWQWVRHRVALADGRTVDHAFVERLLAEERTRIEAQGLPKDNRLPEAAALLATVALSAEFPLFLTIPAYGNLEPPSSSTTSAGEPE
ncbi:MAG: malate synthase A [Candidatus Thermoplasmatota archaeon]|jgi:malate synthase